MIEESGDVVSEENERNLFSKERLKQLWMKNHRVFEILLVIITVTSSGLFLLLYIH